MARLLLAMGSHRAAVERGDVGARTAAIVVNYAAADLVDQCIRRTALADGDVWVVVDNASTADARAEIRQVAARAGASLLEPDSNLGFGGGINLAAAHAIAQGVDVIVMVNPDAFVEADGVTRLADMVRSDPMSLVSPLVIRPDGRHFSSLMALDLDTGSVSRWPGADTERRASTVPWVSGACLAVHASLWEQLGGFDDDYFLYWEDVDLSYRAHRQGARIVCDDTIRAVHDQGGTQEGAGKSPTYYFFNTRNRLVFAEKHLEPATRRRWRHGSLPAAWSILSRGGRRQFLRPGRTIIPAVRGTIAGLTFGNRLSSTPAEGAQ